MKLVMKFGGTSLADAERMRRCARLVQENAGPEGAAAVVSAMDGVTEELWALAEAAAVTGPALVETRLASLRRRHEEAAGCLGGVDRVTQLLAELERLREGIGAVGELTARSRDAVLSFGERLAAALFERALALEGLAPATFTGGEAGLVTDERFGEAEPLFELSLYQMGERVGRALGEGRTALVTGYIAATQHGVTTTLGRGGSDYTATLLGAALGAGEVWIWSDVDGLMSADPRLVPEARLLEQISFAEAVEMAQFGAKAMHPRALEPAAERGIPVRMKNTFNPASPGTLISGGEASGTVARSIHLVQDAGLINVTGAAMIGHAGTAARVFQTLAERGINIRMISQSVSEAGISLAVAGNQLEAARAALESALLRTRAARRVEADREVAIVAVVGSGMRGVPGVAARMFGAIARRGINVIAIAQGSSELSVSFVVSRAAGPEAVRALHEELVQAPGG
ncbi:MAG: aspartate kinase [Candidatus Eisenbacteria bacterium]|uniref:Aspartokinase n=1 Tax=Eiseniibacteriota bacterium TaxID=2212470 RepID=A0A538SNP0_UNCEI|nr:MAG: aspartate kinase [Candidatus Eisenbacteria bacterium]